MTTTPPKNTVMAPPLVLVLLLAAIPVSGGIGFVLGHNSGTREAPRTISDRQACERWAGRCRAAKGHPWINRWESKLPECEKPATTIEVE